jgi:hypothetical protein
MYSFIQESNTMQMRMSCSTLQANIKKLHTRQYVASENELQYVASENEMHCVASENH